MYKYASSSSNQTPRWRIQATPDWPVASGWWCKNCLEGQERLASARHAAHPKRRLRTRCCARLALLAGPSRGPLRRLGPAAQPCTGRCAGATAPLPHPGCT
jgi:hypothetical protein